MATRPVRYELHIRPLVRLIDRENMAWAFDLWDYDQARANADAILLRTAADMPPHPYGGPWPAEWVATFQRWKDEGFLRLDLGTVDTPGYKATRVGETVTLTGRGTTPSSGYRAWLEGVVTEGRPREYVLYWEPPVPAATAAPTLFRAKATFQAPATATEVTVVDAGGRHIVPIVAAPAPLSLRGQFAHIQPVLEDLAASHVQTTPMIGGGMRRYRIGEVDVDVFSDGHSIDIEAPHDLLDRIQRELDQVTKPGQKKMEGVVGRQGA
jgi:hypothetical protein